MLTEWEQTNKYINTYAYLEEESEDMWINSEPV